MTTYGVGEIDGGELAGHLIVPVYRSRDNHLNFLLIYEELNAKFSIRFRADADVGRLAHMVGTIPEVMTFSLQADQDVKLFLGPWDHLDHHMTV